MLTPQRNPRLIAIEEQTRSPTDTSAPLSAHPDVVASHGEDLIGAGQVGESIYTDARKALCGLSEAASTEKRAHDSLLQATNIALNDGGRVMRSQVPPEKRKELHTALTASFDSAARSLDANLKSIKAGVKTLEDAVASKLADPRRNEASTALAASEIRTIMRELQPTERVDAMRSAIRLGDREVINACLGVSPWVLGVSDDFMDWVRAAAAEKWAPAEHKGLLAAKAVEEKVRKASELYLHQNQSLRPKLEEAEPAALKALKKRTGAK